MKVILPLSLKVALWLLLNLVVLAAVAATFVAVTYGARWETLFASPAGKRVHDTAVLVSADLRANPRQSVDDVLARYPLPGDTTLLLFLNDGRQLGGPATLLPADVAESLRSGPRPEPPPGRGRLADPDGPPVPAPGGERPPPGAGRGPVIGFFHHAGSPAAYWIGLRIPVLREDRPLPARGTLIVRVPSVAGLFSLLAFGPWIAAAGAAFLISVLCWLPFVSGVRRALLDLTHATGEIADGRFSVRLASARRDELGVLGDSVNQMAARLEAQVQGQKRFLGDVAHELGSPLARLQVAVELLERRAGPALSTEMADVREEVEQIGVLVNELLAFTKAGLRPRDVALTPVEIAPLIGDILAREDAVSRVAVDIAPGTRVLADAPLLERALGNLVRNALRYAGAAAITISARNDGDQLALVVSDEGPGVPESALPRLGEPFFRPDTARSRESGGTGLGLAIVRTGIAACGGTVAFRASQPHGLTAEIRLARVD